MGNQQIAIRQIMADTTTKLLNELAPSYEVEELKQEVQTLKRQVHELEQGTGYGLTYDVPTRIPKTELQKLDKLIDKMVSTFIVNWDKKQSVLLADIDPKTFSTPTVLSGDKKLGIRQCEILAKIAYEGYVSHSTLIEYMDMTPSAFFKVIVSLRDRQYIVPVNEGFKLGPRMLTKLAASTIDVVFKIENELGVWEEVPLTDSILRSIRPLKALEAQA